MRIVIIGGTGLVGAKLVDQLVNLGHEAIPAARSTGVDLTTGFGLQGALKGATVVVDVSDIGYRDHPDEASLFERASSRLIEASKAAGIRHHVVLSIIGADRFESGFFRAKRRQERIVIRSGVPFTIVRSAPFFEYIYGIVDTVSDGGAVRVPPVRIQPVAALDVARALASIAPSQATNSVVELVGPVTTRLPALAEEILAANEDTRRVIVDPEAPYFGAQIPEEPPVGGVHLRFAPTSFDDWLRKSLEVA
jgi:uncharacterized protein YbjT (DUF2867 family)